MMAKQRPTRLMRPSVEGMTVQQERACLAEIRKIGMGIDPHHVLANGMRAGDFALKYISGHHKKRQEKHKKKLTIDPTTGKYDLIEQDQG